ncbi:helix-turn-helix transcriptional regulator [Temperatibacter marinus]|uniref:Helix-turn-helix transcriptional regulator n=1 Tax=Temperatibacter marinus TaxID=1456591 RepID=A0AA52ECT8_9PROT|nr:helix-turn-helix transcriptional regulator [Temperatibacter marinus]WND01348.1 helix-turn-helix transcriptional regulator [Temperatibacter marinus]
MPDPIDVHVGGRVRMQRTLKGYTQQGLGEVVGLTFQQIQKYERGTNRIGSSRLFRIARALETPIGFFFDDMPQEICGYGKKGMAEHAADFEIDRTVLRRATLEFVRAYYQISDDNVRDHFRMLILAISKSEIEFGGHDEDDAP